MVFMVVFNGYNMPWMVVSNMPFSISHKIQSQIYLARASFDIKNAI